MPKFYWCVRKNCGGIVQSLGRVQLFATPWTAAHQASVSVTTFQSLLKLMSTELVMLSNHFILCCPLLLLPSKLWGSVLISDVGNPPSSPRQAGQMSWSHLADEETEAQGGWGVCAGSQAGHVGSRHPVFLEFPQQGMRLRCSGLMGNSESTA